MRDQYVGDIGDFAKYGLLRYLTGIKATDDCPRLSLGVVWYARPDRGIDYLCDHQTFHSCDPDLFDELRSLVTQNKRTMVAVEERGLLGKDTKYWRHTTPPERSKRKDWLKNALKRLEDCDVVFLDPDKGLHSAHSLSTSTNVSTEHAYLDEVIKAEKNAKVVVLYHSFGREGSHCEQINEKIKLLQSKLQDVQGVFAVRWNTSRPRAFLIICKDSHCPLVQERLQNMVTDWGKGLSNRCHFTLYPK